MQMRTRRIVRRSWKRTVVYARRGRARCAWTEKSTRSFYLVDTSSAVTPAHLHCVTVPCAAHSSGAPSRCSSGDHSALLYHPVVGVRRNFCRGDKVQPSTSWLLWLSRAVLTDAEAPYWHLQSVTHFQLNSTCTGTVNLRYRWIHSVILVSVKFILHEVVVQFQSRHC